METKSFETLEIYIDYDRLKAKDLAIYLQNLSDVATKIVEDFFSRFNNYEGEDLPTLDVEAIKTGNSIKLRLIEGWKPRVRSGGQDNEHIFVEIPKKLGVPIVIGHLLIVTAMGYLGIKNLMLDNQIKEIEKQLKQTELAKAMAIGQQEKQDIQKLTANYIESKIPEVKPILLDTMKKIQGNPDIVQFKVNNIEIKYKDNQ